jgi:acyl carrier protein
VEELCRRILQEVAQRSGLPVKHFVPMVEADLPLTATGKIRRDELVRRYRFGILRPYVLPRPAASAADRSLTDAERWLTNLWRETLGLGFTPSVEDSFFALGGDSLASAALIFAVEHHFSCELPLEDFFRRPTIATLCKLIRGRNSASSEARSRSADRGYGLLHTLHSYVGSWPGERMFPDSLVVGLNCGGYRPPLFWVFQESKEFLRLGKHLGPDQPLYGMRSCVGIVSVKDHSTEIVETVCNRYLWEILALPVKTPIFLGGNCQAGIFALALARRLKQIGRTPSRLILAEWSYSFGRYTEPTLLLYGDRSGIAEIYEGRRSDSPDWREDFPVRTVAAIAGGHGEFFTEENIGGLADAIRQEITATST